MPTLANTLHGQDLFFLQMVANAWGVELPAPDAVTARPILIAEMTQAELFEELFLSLPEKAQDALLAVYENEGHLAWARFSREYGEVRVMGASRRDRERPDLKPANPAEVLWYRGLIGRAFLNFRDEPQEYAYLPEEIIEMLQPFAVVHEKLMPRQASAGEIAFIKLATEEILQDACTYLAGFRKGIQNSLDPYYLQPASAPFLLALLSCEQFVLPGGQLNTDAIRVFLEASRGKSLLHLFQIWINCSQINELAWVSELTFDSLPHINSIQTRAEVLEKITELSENQWWNIESFISIFFQQNPDFLRPNGDFDSWYVVDTASGASLKGFRHWLQVEGRFLRYLICGPLHWLGILDLAGNDQNENIFKSFRLSKFAGLMIAKQIPLLEAPGEEPVEITSTGTILVPVNTKLTTRYQIARFCDWEGFSGNSFKYQISASSLVNARIQGLKAVHLLSLLQKILPHPLPGSVRTALENWEKSNEAIEIRSVSLLRVENPDILSQLRISKTGKFLEEILSPTVAIIRPGAEERVSQAIYEAGYFSLWKIEKGSN